MTPRERHQRNLRRLSLAGGVLSAAAFREIRGLHEESVEELANLVTPRLQPVADRAAAQQAAYLAYRTGQSVPATSATVSADWRSPFTAAWKALGDGDDLDTALVAGESVSDALGRGVVVSAARLAAAALSQSEIVGYRRVLNGDTCDWCVTLTSLTFSSAEAADFGHDRCDCGVEPITR